ncbi:MAG: hypothetical protein CFE44_12275 [Burkholderiales bacterium PBB4]|nr:MAG: hypothetical protein CFE44_12275 [Burkholderiales bacterium PBB4]
MRYMREALEEFPHLQQPGWERRMVYDTIRRMLSAQVYDVIAASTAAIESAQPQTLEDVRHSPPLMGFGPQMREESTDLKRFLFKNLYRHPQVNDMTGRAKQVIADLYNAYMAGPAVLPVAHARRARTASEGPSAGLARVVADYIAGMTDRFAAREHTRLTGQRLLDDDLAGG